MGGREGARGYLAQTIVALLESLYDFDWTSVTLEADHDSDKVDILWEYSDYKKVVQVKSSQNQIKKSDAEKWANELKNDSNADKYVLTLLGPCSGSVAKMGVFNEVLIPCPKNLDFDSLRSEAAHRLEKLLINENLATLNAFKRELIVDALVTRLFVFSTKGEAVTREDLIQLLKNWIISSTHFSNSIVPLNAPELLAKIIESMGECMKVTDTLDAYSVSIDGEELITNNDGNSETNLRSLISFLKSNHFIELIQDDHHTQVYIPSLTGRFSYDSFTNSSAD